MDVTKKSQKVFSRSRWWKPVVTLAVAGLLVLGILVPVTAQSTAARAVLEYEDGNHAGVFFFHEHGEDAVTILGYLTNAPEGFHGFHLHETGECDAPDFESAGDHYNPDDTDHPDHAGDFPSPLVLDNGFALLVFKTDRFEVDDILSEDGTALVLHADPDNFANIPERYGGPDEETLSDGDSGERVACGVVEESSDRSFLNTMPDFQGLLPSESE